MNGISGSADLDYFSGGPEVKQTTVDTSAAVQIESLNALAGQPVSYTASGLITGSPTAIGAYQVTVTRPVPPSCPPRWRSPGTFTARSR